ncbi:MAG: hypothetical protein ACRDA5_01440 [Clostridium sp.]
MVINTINSIICFILGYLACFITVKCFVLNKEIEKTTDEVIEKSIEIKNSFVEEKEEVKKTNIEQANILKEWLMGGDE